MSESDKTQFKDWAWFVLKNGCIIWLLYQWICRHENGALNLLLVAFWLLSAVKLLSVFVKIRNAYVYSETRRALYSALFYLYGGLMIYHDAIITGAVMIVSELLFTVKCKLELKQ